MRKILLTTILSVFALHSLTARTYGNEWIDYSRTHYKIKVLADGMYRIPYSVLSKAIPNLSTLNADHLAMYHNGILVPLYISSIGTTIQAGDYIEFYGKKNIGDIDSVLYPQTGYQPHPYQSAFNDTSIYYLTTNNSTNNPRLVFVPNDTSAIASTAAEAYFWYSSRATYLNTFSGGQPYLIGTTYLYKSLFDAGEGWGSGYVNYGTSFKITLPSPAVYTGYPYQAKIKANIFSRTYENHKIDISLNGNTVHTLTYSSNGYFPVTDSVALSTLLPSSTMSITEQSPATSGPQNLVMYAELTYPRMYDFAGASTFAWQSLPATGKRHFHITNVTDGGTQPLMYDLTNGIIIRSTDAVGTTTKDFVLPPGFATRDMYIRPDNSSSVTLIDTMIKATFTDYTAASAQGDFLIIYNTLIAKDSTGTDWVEQYRRYRDQNANPSGGKYDARTFDIDQLYDQFGYGVRKSGLAIRNFIEYAVDRWTKKPQYLFLIGKGRLYNDMHTYSAVNDACLVPTFGTPGSDNLLTCRRGSNKPLLAVGRLAARTPADIQAYLSKMKIYESQFNNQTWDKPEKLWMKQILHFSGGSTSDEQYEFQSYLADWQTIARDTSWGAVTRTFYKTSSIPIDVSQAQLIQDRVDSGVSLLTFFGHAAGTAFDISIDNPENWHNYQKFPIIYSNGCFSGSLNDNNAGGVNGTFSERFVLTPGKGAIGFMATGSTSVSSNLATYGSFLYSNFCRYRYTQPWGRAMQRAHIMQDSLYGNDDFAMMIAYEMTLHGDPALPLFQFPKPDYEIDEGSVYFNPAKIDAGVDTFTINIITANLGKAIHDSIQVSITRYYTDPVNPSTPLSIVYKRKFKAPYYIDTIAFKIPTLVNLNKGYGLNNFTVFVESESRIDEMSETNNGGNLNFSTLIESDDVIPIYPYTFSIVPTQNPILKASTIDPFAATKTYLVQIDTTELFNNPIGATSITQSGGVLHWRVPFTFRDSTVYYWRVSRDSTAPTRGYNWHTSSFIYLKNEYPGWNQSHFFQYQKDRYADNVQLNPNRIFHYSPTVNTLHVTTGWCRDVGGLPNYFATNLEWDFNSVNEYRFRMGGCGFSVGANKGGITFAVIDTVTNNIWLSQNTGTNYGRFGNFHCSNKTNDQAGFDFNLIGNHPSLGIPWSKVIMNFLDSIPDGNIVLMYSVNKPDWVNTDSVLLNRLIGMGGSNIALLKSGVKAAPYAFYCLKGNPAIHQESIGTDYTGILDTNFTYSVLWYKGNFASTVIGPSATWGSMHWRSTALESPSADHQSVDIYGIQQNGAEVFLKNIQGGDTTLSFVPASLYPYLRLNMQTEDDTTHTPIQLKYWRVLYKAVPEAAMNPNAYFNVQRDTISLGDTLSIGIAIENVSEIAMDSIRTTYTIKNTKTGNVINYTIVQDSLHAFDTLKLKFKKQILNTNLIGLNNITIEANPFDSRHQLEQYHFNNYALLDFSLRGDNINPLLDVTFDGRRIMNGDIVSSRPDILVTLKDENKYLALNDTSLVQVYIRYPNQASPTPFHFDNQVMTFYPATGNLSKSNMARIEIKPVLPQDGTYELLIKDRDRSGNSSSNSTNRVQGNYYYDYKTTFEVINKPMVTNVLNYPNPFSTSTRFDFILTGSEVPDYMKIQIMTITGKIVKEITKDEIGPVHIGHNLTQYAWDGRDEYGDKLANGVYFYRVVMNLRGSQIDRLNATGEYSRLFNNTNIDQYFKHGLGKMVIIR